MSREWNGASYDRVSSPMTLMGRAVLDRLSLRGDELVLDAGCGTGRVTEQLVARLPAGRVVAVDGSRAMIDEARRRLGDRADCFVCDLLELELADPVDAILSTATFHWIRDHERLFARLRAALPPGGQLAAQCGGEGNVSVFYAVADGVTRSSPFAEAFDGWTVPKRFAGPEETERLLRAAGFSDASCWLEPVDVEVAAVEEYLRTVLLGAHLDHLDRTLRGPFVAAVAARVGRPLRLEYVRLNIDAVA